MSWITNVPDGPNQSVLYIWTSEVDTPDNLQLLSSEVKTHKSSAEISFENIDQLSSTNRESSSIAVVVVSCAASLKLSSKAEVLPVIGRLLKLNGILLILSVRDDAMTSQIKLAGLNLVNEDSDFIKATKKIEVGFSRKLPFAGSNIKPAPPRVWKISDDDDLIDTDAILTDADRAKPSADTLKAECGPGSGKKKACKDCSCGLAEELAGLDAPPVKSSCGSCYLGDAFRCSSCPYLGMPPFKPGEIVQIDADK
jgi:hypothetical protein